MAIVSPLCGIYAIRCNGKVYIGSSNNIKNRWHMHRYQLRHNCHGNIYLQAAWNDCDENEVRFEIIELCTTSTRLERERYWLYTMRATEYEFGYNIKTLSNEPAPYTSRNRQKKRPVYIPKEYQQRSTLNDAILRQAMDTAPSMTATERVAALANALSKRES